MKRFFAWFPTLFFAAIFSGELSAQSSIFDWSNPQTLSPSFPAPDEQNRYGEYIGNVEFVSGPVTLTIDDSEVIEQSQRARFLWGYMTQIVEMRAYRNSVIKITASDDEYIKNISFEGAKVSDQQLTLITEGGNFANRTWSADDTDVRTVEFFVEATINCTLTAVETGTASVSECYYQTDVPQQWFTVQGICLSEKPVTPGVYILRKGNNVTKVAVR